MFESVKITGQSVYWAAVPEGWQPSGTCARAAVGGEQTLAMLSDAVRIVDSLPRQPKTDPDNLVIMFHPELTKDSRYGRDIKKAVSQIERKGDKVGVKVSNTRGGMTR